LTSCAMQAAAKRFRLTGTGKLMGRHPGKQHLNEKMSRGEKQRLSKDFMVSPDKARNVASMLPNSGIPH
jgi:large subunit ribosomal protein L35